MTASPGLAVAEACNVTPTSAVPVMVGVLTVGVPMSTVRGPEAALARLAESVSTAVSVCTPWTKLAEAVMSN